MKNDKSSLQTVIDSSGVKFQAVEWGGLNVAHVQFPKGADAAPLLEGMPGNLCQCPHWGYVLKGSVHVKYGDGKEEQVKAGEVYHWPAGHTVWTDEDYESVEFSPAPEMSEVLGHLKKKMGG